MPSSSEELKSLQEWENHHATNPLWPSERRARVKRQSEKDAVAALKARTAARRAAAAAAPATTTSATPAVDINNTNLRQASTSDSETVFASSCRSSTVWGSSTPSPPKLQSQSPVISGVLPAPAAPAQAAANSWKEPLTDPVLPMKTSPSAIPLANMFDDVKDVNLVDKSEFNVESITQASSSSVKKRKSPFGDDDSEGESDFEGRGAAKKAKSSSIDAAAGSKCKRREDADKLTKTKLTSTTIVKHASALENGPSGCYQNTVLHLLSSIPAFAAMGTEEPVKSAKQGVAPAFGRMMHKMLNNTSGKAISTGFFRKACGDFLGRSFNGETQEDADEFLCVLVERLQKERPDLELAGQLEAPKFVRTAECANCGAFKVVDDMLAPLVPSMNDRSVSFNSLLEKQEEDTSNFTLRTCDGCKVKGKYKTDTKAARLTMRGTPRFLKVIISRCDPTGRSAAKNRTNVFLQPECSFLSENGEKVRYELVAAAGHCGRTPDRGHWMALRKIEKKWFQCDSAGDVFEGVKRLERMEFKGRSTHPGMCLFRKIE